MLNNSLLRGLSLTTLFSILICISIFAQGPPPHQGFTVSIDQGDTAVYCPNGGVTLSTPLQGGVNFKWYKKVAPVWEYVSKYSLPNMEDNAIVRYYNDEMYVLIRTKIVHKINS